MSNKLSKTIGLKRKYAFPTVSWNSIDSWTCLITDMSFLVYPNTFIGPEILSRIMEAKAGEDDMVNNELDCTYILILLSEAD